NDYAAQTMRLQFAAPDAESIATLFEKRGPVLYGSEQVNVTRILNEAATRQGIRETLKQVARKTRPQDTVVVFFAGHGMTVGQRYYFVTHEFSPQATRLEDDIRQNGLAIDAIGEDLGEAPALKRVLIFDTCQSGGALPVARTARDPFAFRGSLERVSRAQ